MKDIYFRAEYAQLSQIIDGGKAECFEYVTDIGSVTNRFIKREVPHRIDGEQYYDLITPYGYGGPLITTDDDGAKARLAREYEAAFSEYCRDNRILSEFVRFHPLYNNAPDFTEVYHPQAIRKTVGTDLTREDPVAEEFSKSCRKSIRRALNAGVTYRVVRNPSSIDTFIDAYYATMERDAAAAYYFFDKTYFDTMLDVFGEDMILTEALYEDRVIAANICFVTDGNIHVHLSGTRSEYLSLSPAYVLKYADAVWGKENGCRCIHYGGGVSNSPEDPLFLFKKKFGQHTEFDFYIGKKIWDPARYQHLCRELQCPQHSDFFPAYRQR